MAEFPSQGFALQVADGGSPSNLVTVGALIDCSLSIQDEPDDITSKGSAGARELYTAGAVKSYEFSGNLVVTDENGWTDLRTAKESSDPRIYCSIDDGQSVYAGYFAISNLTLSGGNAGAVRAAVTLMSTGAVSVTAS